MTDVSKCRVCKTKLVGDVGNTFITIGNFVYLVTRNTSHCNWRRCKGCKDVLCKDCYDMQYQFCCAEDRIVCRERAQTIADLEHQKTKENTLPADSLPESVGAN